MPDILVPSEQLRIPAAAVDCAADGSTARPEEPPNGVDRRHGVPVRVRSRLRGGRRLLADGRRARPARRRAPAADGGDPPPRPVIPAAGDGARHHVHRHGDRDRPPGRDRRRDHLPHHARALDPPDARGDGAAPAGSLSSGAHGHSHGLVDDSIKRSREGVRAVLLALAVLGAAALVQAFILVATGSVALLADLIHNVGDALTAVPLGIAFWMRSDAAERYAGLEVVLAIFVSAVVAG